jgi:hypothetical protein
VLSLYAKGLTTGEISAHFAEIYGAQVSKETISRITDKVIEEMQAWQQRPLDVQAAHLAARLTDPPGWLAGRLRRAPGRRERAGPHLHDDHRTWSAAR